MHARRGPGLTLMAVLLVTAAHAEVRLPRCFSHDMILQRDQAVPVWGWAEAGEKVTIAFAGQTLTAVPGADGKWMARFKPMRANGTGQALTVAGRNSLVFTNVVVGDVWLCSGQSNMNFMLTDSNSAADLAAADYPQLRYFRADRAFFAEPQTDIRSRQAWVPVTPKTAGRCSAVAFFFGRRLLRETGVPIGLLISAVGATEIEHWMPAEAVNDHPENAKVAQEWREALAARAAAAVPDAPAWPEMSATSPRGLRVTSLFNGMIHPLIPFGIKGALWYQGESNGGQEEVYLARHRAMIETWRKRWGLDFPFYFVQLANWHKVTDDPAGTRDWALTRMGQLKTLTAVPQTGMAVAIDLGEAEDIHPKNKFDVGERLALWALAKDYGKKDLVYSGPVFKAMTVEGARARITFEPWSVGSGLMAGKKAGRVPAAEDPAAPLKRFAVAGANKKWFWADARIEGHTVVVSSPEVPNPVAVRYAFSNNPEGANLYNKDGLPASPFRTDAW